MICCLIPTGDALRQVWTDRLGAFFFLVIWGGRRRFTGTYMMLICLFVTVSRDCSRLQCSTFTSLSDIRLPDQRKFLHPVNTSVHIPTLPLSRTSTLLSLSFAPACLHQTHSFILAPNFLHLRFSCTLHPFCMKQSRNYFHKSSLYRLCKSFPEAFFFFQTWIQTLQGL